MLKIKRIHTLLTFNRTLGLPVGLNECYRLRQTGRFERGADRRAAKDPSEYNQTRRKRQMRPLVPKEAQPSVGHSGPCRKYEISPWEPLASSVSPPTFSSRALPMRAPLRTPDKFGQSNY